jgi:uncharacterized protein (DUF488 family)
MPIRIWTVGHSTRSWEDFVELLSRHGVRAVVDVRQFPASRRFPQFNGPAMAGRLPAAGIDYVHEVDLGGRRRPRPDSPNTYWRHAQFRGYADHQSTPAYRAALERLIRIAERQPTAILCAEAVPWRCHRQLIADSLTLRGFEVRHILSPERTDLHLLNPAIRLGPGSEFHYAADDSLPLFDSAEGTAEPRKS